MKTLKLHYEAYVLHGYNDYNYVVIYILMIVYNTMIDREKKKHEYYQD